MKILNRRFWIFILVLSILGILGFAWLQSRPPQRFVEESNTQKAMLEDFLKRRASADEIASHYGRTQILSGEEGKDIIGRHSVPQERSRNETLLSTSAKTVMYFPSSELTVFVFYGPDSLMVAYAIGTQ